LCQSLQEEAMARAVGIILAFLLVAGRGSA